MAKESIKARDRKKIACVAKYAVKRAALKEAGDLIGIDKLPRLQVKRQSQQFQRKRYQTSNFVKICRLA